MLPVSLPVPTNRRNSIKVAGIQPTDSHTGAHADRFAAKKAFSPQRTNYRATESSFWRTATMQKRHFCPQNTQVYAAKEGSNDTRKRKKQAYSIPWRRLFGGKSNCNSPNNRKETGFPIARIRLNFSLWEQTGAGEIFQFQIFQLDFNTILTLPFYVIYIYILNSYIDHKGGCCVLIN